MQKSALRQRLFIAKLGRSMLRAGRVERASMQQLSDRALARYRAAGGRGETRSAQLQSSENCREKS
jgi:hypothetical protein